MSRKIENLYNRFKVMLIKRDEASKNRVTAILKSIDEELAKKKTRFLTGIYKHTREKKITRLCRFTLVDRGEQDGGSRNLRPVFYFLPIFFGSYSDLMVAVIKQR